MARVARAAVAALMMLAAPAAHADALGTLHAFVAQAKTGRAEFHQTVTSPDGAKKKASSGTFAFSRPDRFRFAYTKPYEQLIVGDGKKVRLYDADLNQVTVRPFDQALGATPASLLSGTGLERDFELSSLPDEGGLQWVQALPRTKEGTIKSLKIGFDAQSGQLAALEIADAFGQRSRLDFDKVQINVELPANAFVFTPPAGADVIAR